jgi:benzoyl-CoA reductase subunit D
VLVTGGLASDVGLLAALAEGAVEQKAPFTVEAHSDSVLAGALGAAIWGAFRVRKLSAHGVDLLTGGAAA